jgi:predicted dehydrogenase/threonine dehydrogenase-like Zn-dependent dehydrogenase
VKAVVQNFRTGELSVTDVPPPAVRSGQVLVHNVASLVSAGTERAVIELARMNPVRKARARPDLVRKVLARAGQEGLLGTARVVMNLASTPLPLGYSCAGVVRAVGATVSGLSPGDRVACAGLGYANHAEVVTVPRNLVVPIPEGVEFDEAAFVTVGAIALQGVRQAALSVGESVVVIGLGLVGLLTVQICVAAGVRVFGVDLSADRVRLASELGAASGESVSAAIGPAVSRFTRQRGADAIIIAAATPSSEPVALAAEIARDRARVIVVGDVGLDIPRRAYYEKELELRLSRSYGPGRYDSAYEEKGHDYPVGYVRWTENRNMEAFLDLVAAGKVRVGPLVTQRFPIEQATDAYDLLTDPRAELSIGILLEYDPARSQPAVVATATARDATDPGRTAPRAHGVRFGVIGAGQFAQGVLLPHLRRTPGASIVAVATGSGLTARRVADRYGCGIATSDYREILRAPDVDAVLVATRHDLHARLVVEALEAGKHVFVEKPLAMSEEELVEIARAGERPSALLAVGFNRRFSPLSVALQDGLGAGPFVMSYRVNAGPLPPNSWIADADVGGGRIVGEVCHFVDLMQFLTRSDPVEVFAWALPRSREAPGDPDDVSIQVRFAEGSVGSIMYVASSDPRFSKERLEVLGAGVVGVIDNWRSVRIHRGGRRRTRRALLGAAKGHAEELRAFVAAVESGRPPVPFVSLLLTTATTFAIQRSLREGRPIGVAVPGD